MPSILRSRLALFALLGAFLIPIGMSSLRGLTHVLTCQDEVKTPFSMVVPKQGPAQVVSSTRIQRAEKDTLCGGLSLNIGGRPQGPGKVAMHLPITNDSPHLWRGTVKLLLDETPIPVDIGEIDAGETESDTVVVRLDPGSHQVDGSLLIGP